MKWLCLQLFPNRQNSSMKDQKSTKKEIAEHYDRGNDFFNAFLGPSMVYTSGVFRGIKQSLEEAQVNKMDMICQKLGVSLPLRLLALHQKAPFPPLSPSSTHTRLHLASSRRTTSSWTLAVAGAPWCATLPPASAAPPLV